VYNQSKGDEPAASAGATDKEDTSILIDNTGDEVAEVDEGKKKKRKHKKHHEDDVSEVASLAKEDVEIAQESVGRKKKKKEKSVSTDKGLTNGEPESSINNQLDIQLLSDSQLPLPDEGETKKKKKKSQGNAIWLLMYTVTLTTWD